MRVLQMFLLLALFLAGAEAFTTKKKERRAALSYVSMPMEPINKDQSQSLSGEEQALPPAVYDPNNAIFFFPNAAGQVQAIHFYEVDDEPNIPYGVALVSCMLSLALGFGLGYGT